MSLTRSTRSLTTSKVSVKPSPPKAPQTPNLTSEGSSPPPAGGYLVTRASIHVLSYPQPSTPPVENLSQPSKILGTYPPISVDNLRGLWTSREVSSLICMTYVYFRMLPVDKPVDKEGKFCE